MSSTYVKTAFTVVVTTAEADLIRQAISAADILQANEPDEHERLFTELGSEFASVFPPEPDNAFAGFMSIFEDPNHPYLCCGAEFIPADDNNRVVVSFAHDQFSVAEVAELLFRIAKSALPFGFDYALDCDRLRPGEFGGGYILATAQGVEWALTSELLDRALQRASLSYTPEKSADGYVLAAPDEEGDWRFWDNEGGFGPLKAATVFSDREIARVDKPMVHPEPRWLALPRPLSV